MADINLNTNNLDSINDANNALREQGFEVRRIGENWRGVREHQTDYLYNLKESIFQQKEMRKGTEGLTNQLKQIAKVQRDIKSYEKERLRIEKLLKETASDASDAQKLALNNMLADVKKETKSLEAKQKLLEENYRVVNKTGIVFKDMAKQVGNLPGLMKNALSYVKGFGIFEMDKAIKSTALNMGLFGEGAMDLSANITSAQDAAIGMGVTIEQLAQSQAAYSEELGRSVMLGKQGLLAISQISKGTGMAAEAASKLTAEMDIQGSSAERTRDFVEQTMNDASQMGLNAAKVVKNIQNNIKLLNKYNFKNGVKGLAKMAEEVTKLGIDMNDITPMADKLWNIEGAVEMSAQLQVLGGKWSALADPFKLMYMARNDVEGLTKAVADAASESASFDSEGNITLATVEMSRLKEVAEKTGVSYDALVTAGKNMAKLKKIKSQFSISGLSPKEEELLANTAQIDANGKAFIEVGGEKKFLSSLDGSAKQLLKSKAAETATLDERAKASMSFDEQITALIQQFKQYLLPFATELAKANGPDGAITKFRAWLEKEDIGGMIQKAAKWLGETVGKFLSFAADHTYEAAAAILLGKAAGWISNGLLLAQGFNLGTKGFMGSIKSLFGKGNITGTGGIPPAVPPVAGAAPAAASGGASSTIGGVLGAAAVAGVVKDQFDFFSSKSARQSGASGWLESLGGSGLSLVDWIPGVNQAIEATGLSIDNMGTDSVALARAVYRSLHPKATPIIPNKDLINDINKNPDKYPDSVVDDAKDVKINDGVIKFNPKDKFMKVNDSTMIAGTNENGNQSLAKALLSTGEKENDNTSKDTDAGLGNIGITVGNTIKSILSNIGTSLGISSPNNKDNNQSFMRDLLNYQFKSSTPTTTTTTTASKVELSDLNISGTIELKINGETSKSFGSELLHNPIFIRDITKMVHMATASAVSGRQPQKV